MSLLETMLKDADEAMLRGDPQAAERLYAHVRDQDPGNADAWNGTGSVRFERGDLDGSLAAYEQAKALARPETRTALRALKGIALNLFRMGRRDQAEAALAELQRLDPDDRLGAGFLLEDIRKGRSPWKKRP
jgi:tetratricopeptide (TPR) repeat protein